MENETGIDRITFCVDFEVGQVVYLATDIEQLPRMVIGYIFIGYSNEIKYVLVQGDKPDSDYHRSIEIRNDKDKTLMNEGD